MHVSCTCATTVSVKAVLERNGLILIVRNKEGNYDLPGGRSFCGEELLVTLNRELVEEVGLDKYSVDVEPVFAFAWKNEQRQRHGVVIGYRLQSDQEEFRSSDPEITEVAWISPAKFLMLPMPQTWRSAYQEVFSRPSSSEQQLSAPTTRKLGTI